MATLQELEARREELIKRRESLVTRARTGDKDVQYDPSHTDAALRLLDDQIEKAGGTVGVRHARIHVSKGL
jgi:hypothetical protein